MPISSRIDSKLTNLLQCRCCRGSSSILSSGPEWAFASCCRKVHVVRAGVEQQFIRSHSLVTNGAWGKNTCVAQKLCLVIWESTPNFARDDSRGCLPLRRRRWFVTHASILGDVCHRPASALPIKANRNSHIISRCQGFEQANGVAEN
jgi:hypothetical protein